MSLPVKLLTDMATFGNTPTIRQKILECLTRHKIDVRAYFEDPNSPAIVRAWNNDAPIQDWIREIEQAVQDVSTSRDIIYKGMSPEEECNASIALMDPFFKKCHFGKGGLRIYRVVDVSQKLLSAVERNDEEEFTITNVLKAYLRENNCILSVRKIKQVKNWWLGYGEDVPRPKLCALPDEDVWCQWRIPISPDADAIQIFHSGLS